MDIDEEIGNEEKKMLISKMFALSFMPTEVTSLLSLVDDGYNSSQILHALTIYDLSDHQQQIKAVEEVGNSSKLEKILTNFKKGILISPPIIRSFTSLFFSHIYVLINFVLFISTMLYF